MIAHIEIWISDSKHNKETGNDADLRQQTFSVNVVQMMESFP